MKNFKTILVTTIALTLICVVTAAALGFTNELTAKRIAEVERKAEQEAMTRVISAADYKQATTVINESTYTYYTAVDAEGAIYGYIFTTSANGYGGEVKVMVGVDTEGVVSAIEVLDVSNETPGLGQNAGKKSFWEQFKGKSSEIGVSHSDPDENEVQAITGATITTTAVKNAVNKALSIYSNIEKEAGNNG